MTTPPEQSLLHEKIDRLEEECDRLIAFCWRNNLCPYGMVRQGEPVGTCIVGFPGCACMDSVVRQMPDEPPPDDYEPPRAA